MPDSEPTEGAGPSESSERDREIVVRALRGDQGAYRELVRKYTKALHHHISKMVRDNREVDDLVQESFIKAFSALRSYSADYAFSTWLYRIATNHAIDFLRKRRLSTFSIDKPIRTRDGELRFEIPDTTYRPDRHVVRDQSRELIRQAIDSLPPKYYRVIELRHGQEKSYDEIARELSLPLGTVKAHIFRGRKLLYKYLRTRREAL